MKPHTLWLTTSVVGKSLTFILSWVIHKITDTSTTTRLQDLCRWGQNGLAWLGGHLSSASSVLHVFVARWDACVSSQRHATFPRLQHPHVNSIQYTSCCHGAIFSLLPRLAHPRTQATRIDKDEVTYNLQFLENYMAKQSWQPTNALVTFEVIFCEPHEILFWIERSQWVSQPPCHK